MRGRGPPSLPSVCRVSTLTGVGTDAAFGRNTKAEVRGWVSRVSGDLSSVGSMSVFGFHQILEDHY